MNQFLILSDQELCNVTGGGFWGDMARGLGLGGGAEALGDAIDRQNDRLANNRGGAIGGSRDCGASRGGGSDRR